MYVTALFTYLAVILTLVVAGKNNYYSRFTVYGVELSKHSHSKLIQKLEVELDLDIWQYGVVEQREAIIMVSQENRIKFLNLLDENGVRHYLYLSDVVKALDKHDEEVTRWKQSRTQLVPFEDYPRYVEVDDYLGRIAREYPNLVALVNCGPSFQGRPIKYLKISTTNFEDHSKPIYFIDAMIHAREWVGAPVAFYAIHKLIEDLRDTERDLLENTDGSLCPL